MAEMETTRRGRRNPFAAFIRDRKAATAVEFALVAAPFLAITVALIQTFLVFFAQAMLETITRNTSRLIMTGQVQTQNMTQAAFLQQLCNQGSILFNCATSTA